MDEDDSTSSVSSMLLDDPVDENACTSAEGDDIYDARVVVCESSDMSTM